MAEGGIETIRPNAGFVREIIENGGETLKKCFQCGACSVVCELSPDGGPFPRKEMIWAQWGLEDRLVTDGDVWLCHQCNDCSTHCPRGAKPGDVMAAVRNIQFSRRAMSPFLALMMSRRSAIVALLLFPLFMVGSFVRIAAEKDFMTLKPMLYTNMLSETAVDLTFLPPLFFSFGAAYFSIKWFWAELSKKAAPKGSKLAASLEAGKEILAHTYMKKCVTNAPRATAHMLTMYGFLALMATTAMVGMLYWANKLGVIGFEYHQIGLTHPARLVVKLVGNIGAIVALTGVTLLIMRRYGADRAKTGVTTYYDSHFIFLLYISIITGLLAEMFRVLDIAELGFGVYFIHLVAVFTLLVYAPFSKFAHLMFRFTALVHAKMAGRVMGRSA